jgi:hypothetical protein
MSRAEQIQASNDRNQQLARIVGDILAVNTIETELRSFTGTDRLHHP